MPATQEKPKARMSREAGRPATKTIAAKQKKAKAPQRPIRNLKEAREEEQNEGEAESLRGQAGGKPMSPEHMVANDNYCISNWSDPSWLDEDGNRITVSNWFPTQKVAIDYPDDEDELKAKQTAFKKLKVPYIGVLPGQPLQVDKARQQLRAQGAKI